ncbi:integrase family protein [Methanolacinia petrolearia DSM 11571]|uniref:Integrase family protein n=1 Tax=Methanolacinia petrolearia (strain DSM 11571 / OCM 486 / SEBR 4847) TaxID=679926 RepID=E1RJI7_METP4|nr:tyrosine-type recombinase/integrase [Methanolacinia petrolearia]ADN36793.1 integrase family protein [Methanolacinia petrolearia DSM 11571]
MDSYFEKLPSIDEANIKYLESYVKHLELKQLSEQTIQTKVWRNYNFLISNGFKDSKQVTQDDVENYFIKRRKECSQVTVNGEILEIKLFFRWLVGKETEEALFENVKIKRVRSSLPTDQLLTRYDIEKLVNACDRQRDRAIIMLLWDTGARIGEIVSLNIGHIEFDRYGAVVIVKGKTGMRRLRLISSVPDLQAWINVHPLRDRSDAPLFTTFTRYGNGNKRLNHHTIQNMLKRVAQRANVHKRIHPHAIRHARLTDLVKNEGGKRGLSEMELRVFAGWEKNSNMPEVYVHLSGGDIERKMLENAGLIDEDQKQEKTLEPVICPRCKTSNPSSALYCTNCSMVLNQEGAIDVEESINEAKGSDDYSMLLEKLKKDLGIA